MFFVTYIQGNYLVYNLPALDGTTINWSNYKTDSVISIILWIVIIVITIILVKKIKIDKTIHYYKIASLVILAMLCVSLGGNIQTLGRRYDETAWKIGIKDPEEPEKIICSVEVINKAVITSAGYERYFTDEYGKKYPHIFDSKTGYPAESDILSATIISKDGYYGDALSTAFYVMGSEKAYKLWQKQKDFDFIIITNDKEIFISENLEKMVKVSEASDYYFRTLP